MLLTVVSSSSSSSERAQSFCCFPNCVCVPVCVLIPKVVSLHPPTHPHPQRWAAQARKKRGILFFSFDLTATLMSPVSSIHPFMSFVHRLITFQFQCGDPFFFFFFFEIPRPLWFWMTKMTLVVHEVAAGSSWERRRRRRRRRRRLLNRSFLISDNKDESVSWITKCSYRATVWLSRRLSSSSSSFWNEKKKKRKKKNIYNF